MVDWGLFAKNQPTKHEPGNKVISTILAKHLLQHQRTKLIREHKHPQVLTMLHCQFKNIVKFFPIQLLEQHGYNQTVYEAYLAPILESVA